METLLLSIRLLLSAVFVVAAVAKFADRKGARKTLEDFGLPAALSGAGAWLLPITEIAAAIALIPAVSAWWGAAAVLALLAAFILAIVFNLARGQRPDCRCFGQLSSSPIGWKTIARNTALAGLAIVVVWQGREGAGPGPAGWWSGLAPLEAVIAGFALFLVTAGAAALVLLLHLLKQNGRLMLRLEAVESKLGVDPDALPERPAFGLPLNDPAPRFTLETLEGRPAALAQIFEQDLPVLLFFMEPGCGACDEILPDVARWQREQSARLRVVPISRGPVDKNRAKAAQHDLRGLLLQKDREVAVAYMAEGSPSAVVVSNGRIASSVAAGSAYIRALVKRGLQPAGLKTGDPVPALRLPNLDGSMFDLTQIRKRTLMVFWNPSCGFCQKMRTGLLDWEGNRPAGASELLIVSAGSVESIHGEGFRSTVLLDPKFEAAKAFGSGGTPSAILIENGRVASTVAVGAQAISDLAGPVALSASAR